MSPRIAIHTSATTILWTAGLLCMASCRPMLAQTSVAEPTKAATDTSKAPSSLDGRDRWTAASVDRTYKLQFVQSQRDANDIVTAVRNITDPRSKVFLVPDANVIAVSTPEEEQARIAKLLAALDHPHARYRLTYTVSELDGTHKVGVQHFAMVVLSGERTQLKQGSRVPLIAASAQVSKPGDVIPAYTYIDIGMNFEVTFIETQGGGTLRSKVEQSSVAPDSMAANGGNPIIRQTFFEGSVAISAGKPLTIGSLDVPGSTHHFDVDVMMEPVN